MADRCPTNVYYEFHGMGVEVCPYICNNKTDYGYCKTSACIYPTHRTSTFTSYDPIEIARKYAPKFDKPVVDMVEVVRCKDCKHLNKEEMRCFEVEGLGYRNVADDDFCSRGERMDEVEK